MRDNDRPEFAAAYTTMAKRFGKNPLDTLDSDFRDLDGFGVDVVVAGLVDARRTCRYFPRPEELITRCLRETQRLKALQGFHTRPEADTPLCPTCGAGLQWHKYFVLVGEDRKRRHGVERRVIRHGTGELCERFNGGREFV